MKCRFTGSGAGSLAGLRRVYPATEDDERLLDPPCASGMPPVSSSSRSPFLWQASHGPSVPRRCREYLQLSLPGPVTQRLHCCPGSLAICAVSLPLSHTRRTLSIPNRGGHGGFATGVWTPSSRIGLELLCVRKTT